MRRSLPLLAALLAFLFVPAISAGGAPPVRITLLHVNDFHGRLQPAATRPGIDNAPTGGAALLAGRIRAERGKDPDGTLLLSAGDMFQGTPASNLFHGSPVLEIMNVAGFDAMALGNHEFDWGQETLDRLRAGAAFPFLSSTVVGGEGKPLPGVAPFVVLERKGVRIAVIGVTTPETPYSTRRENVKGLSFPEPAEILPEILRRVRSRGVDLVVVLSHLGFPEDKKLAAVVPGIDVILGGHTHTVVTTPARIGRTVVAQAGFNGLYLGVIRIEADPESGRVEYLPGESGLLPVSAATGVPADAETERIVESYRARLAGEFRRIVGRAGVDLVRNDDRESNIGNMLCDAVRSATGADAAFMNAYGIRADIQKGEITLEQLYTMLPFENTILTVELSGEEIAAALERGATLENGMLQVSGVTFRVDLSKPKGSRVSGIRIGGKPLERKGRYRVAMNDFLAAGGDRYDSLREGSGATAGGDFRDMVIGYLRARSPVEPRVEGRIEVIP